MIEKDTDRDNFMSSNEALSYGIVDKIIDNKKIYYNVYFFNQIDLIAYLAIYIDGSNADNHRLFFVPISLSQSS